jgi:hypothetical protein
MSSLVSRKFFNFYSPRDARNFKNGRNFQEFQNCCLCKKTKLSTKVEFKSHLVDYHTKESLAEFIVNAVNKI